MIASGTVTALIGPDFYEHTLVPYSAEEQERINTFDWRAAFPDVFEREGFDCVVGNPPYVKHQNFRKFHTDMAAHLSRARKNGGGLSQYPDRQFRTFTCPL